MFRCFLLPLPSKMAVLQIFNPEHDIALAANLSNFTAPHAGRQLRHDLGICLHSGRTTMAMCSWKMWKMPSGTLPD